MSISILNRGASGGLKPELIITAPAGSTIDLLQGGIIIDTYTLGLSETTHVFVVKMGSYTVTGTLGANVVDYDIIVDSVKQYEMEVVPSANYIMLYDHGDECTDVTGGWVAEGKTSADNYNQQAGFLTANSFNMGEYSRVGLLGLLSASNTSYTGYFGLAESQTLKTGVTSFRLKFGSSKTFCSAALAVDGDKYATVHIAWSSDSSFTFVNTKNSDHLYVNSYRSTSRYSRASYYAVALFKPDDWQTLCAKAGVSAPSTLDELTADTTALTTILSNKSAVDFMAKRCTGDFMCAAVSTEAFLTALEASVYKEFVYANEHWAKFLAMVG